MKFKFRHLAEIFYRDRRQWITRESKLHETSEKNCMFESTQWTWLEKWCGALKWQQLNHNHYLVRAIKWSINTAFHCTMILRIEEVGKQIQKKQTDCLINLNSSSQYMANKFFMAFHWKHADEWQNQHFSSNSTIQNEKQCCDATSEQA